MERIGLVIIGRNEGDRLVRCFESVADEGATAIVYVDSGSTDRSVAEAERRDVHVVRLDMSRPFTAGRARNEGFAALLEQLPAIEFVQFLDGDCELVAGWLGRASAYLDAHPDVAVVCGRRRERDPGASAYNRLCDAEWDTPIGEAMACGGDSLVRASAFRAVGGFDARLIAGEEPELCHRLRATGARIWRLDAPMTLHDAAMHRFSQWWLRGIRSGFGYAQVWKTTRGDARPLYQRELLRALFWAGVLPLCVLAISLFLPWFAVILPLIYGLQVARIALRRGHNAGQSWDFALFTMLAKFPELVGVARFFIRHGSGRTSQAILYK